jgi:hypothetical protein
VDIDARASDLPDAVTQDGSGMSSSHSMTKRCQLCFFGRTLNTAGKIAHGIGDIGEVFNRIARLPALSSQ